MNNSNQPRVPAGTPEGGQFAPSKAALENLLGPVLAEGMQEGYTLRIHGRRTRLGNPWPSKPARITDSTRSFEGAGVKSYQAPSGEVVLGGKWMDWAEKHYPKSYVKLPAHLRAELEVEEQKKYGYKKNFQFHKSLLPRR